MLRKLYEGEPSHHNHSHTINHLIYHNDCTIRTTFTIRCHEDTGSVSNCFIQLRLKQTIFN